MKNAAHGNTLRERFVLIVDRNFPAPLFSAVIVVSAEFLKIRLESDIMYPCIEIED